MASNGNVLNNENDSRFCQSAWILAIDAYRNTDFANEFAPAPVGEFIRETIRSALIPDRRQQQLDTVLANTIGCGFCQRGIGDDGVELFKGRNLVHAEGAVF
ncbi:hypothetical protein SAMN05216599_104196 [Pseudomonas cichorii]|nr:hypothetical protein SAMN05216599_104196 [Pseudomonas cichorii]